MPKQASSRARYHGHSWQGPVMCLHLSGRLRKLTSGLRRLEDYPQTANTHLQFPELVDEPGVWSVNHEKRQVLICLDWRRPIVIYLDNEVPQELEHLACFEVNYIGLLLLEPVPVLNGQRYRRVGCAQTHRESCFFDEAEVESFTLV